MCYETGLHDQRKKAELLLVSLEKEKILNKIEDKLSEKDEKILNLEKSIAQQNPFDNPAGQNPGAQGIQPSAFPVFSIARLNWVSYSS